MGSRAACLLLSAAGALILCTTTYAQDFSVQLHFGVQFRKHSPSHTSIRAKDLIEITVTSKNLSDVAVIVPDGEDWYRPILYRDMIVVAYTASVMKRIDEMDKRDVYTATGLGVLKPGETRERKLDLSYWYGTLPIGHYRLSIERRFFKQKQVSDTIEFDVVE